MTYQRQAVTAINDGELQGRVMAERQWRGAVTGPLTSPLLLLANQTERKCQSHQYVTIQVNNGTRFNGKSTPEYSEYIV